MDSNPPATLPVAFDINKTHAFFIIKKASGTAIITVPKAYTLDRVKYEKHFFGQGSTTLSFYSEREYPTRREETFHKVTIQEHNMFCNCLQQHFYDIAFVERI